MAKRLRQLGLVLAVTWTMASLGTLDTKAARVTCLVSTTNGAVQGLDVGASCTFLGIPYAAAPTNARRWKAPESPGPLPVSGDFDERVAGAGAPLLRATAHGYRIWVQWMTELDEDAVFARWLFVPASGDIPSR